LLAGPFFRRHARWLLPLVLLAAVTAAYARAPRLNFVYDDDLIVRKNPFIVSAKNIPVYFTQHIWSSLMTARKNYYRPVFLLWLLANFSAFGTDPVGWHLTSLLLHLGNTLLLYFLALRLIRQRFAALVAAFIFGLHPVQVETVAWVSASTELLGSFFSLASVLAYLRARDPGKRAPLWMGSSLLLYAAGSLAKETALILPAVIFLHEWLGRPASEEQLPPRPWRVALVAALRESAPFFAVAIAYMAARIAVLGGVGQAVVRVTPRTFLFTLPSVLHAYLVHLLWPVRLGCFYDYPYVETFSFRSVALPLVEVLAIVLALFLAVRESRAAQLSVFWMVLPLLPSLDIAIFPHGEIVHDRYLYHPVLGLSLLAGLGIAWLGRQLANRPGARLCGMLAAAGMILALAGLTFRQTRFWMDNFALYSRGVEIAPRNGFANNNLGVALLARGDANGAMDYFQRSLQYDPNLWLAKYDIGIVYYNLGDYPKAEEYFRKTIVLRPEDSDSHLYLGMTFFRTGRRAQAIDSIRRAIALNPQGQGYHFALAIILKEDGDLNGARSEFQAELKRDPNQQESINQLRILEQEMHSAAAEK
jgi:tetratricopeptide (TPR) repeat protein